MPMNYGLRQLRLCVGIRARPKPTAYQTSSGAQRYSVVVVHKESGVSPDTESCLSGTQAEVEIFTPAEIPLDVFRPYLKPRFGKLVENSPADEHAACRYCQNFLPAWGQGPHPVPPYA